MMIKGVTCIKIVIKDYGYFLFMVKKFMYIQEESKITATYLRDTYLYKDCCRRCALGLNNCNIAVGDAE